MPSSNALTVLVTGANGQLGRELAFLAAQTDAIHWQFADRTALDLTNLEAIEPFVAKQRPDIIINCAAYTAVDKAESEATLADVINHQAVARLAQSAKQCGARLIHVSTDYVFNGEQCRPYNETDATDPQSVYGSSKLAGEQAFIASGAAGIIVRTSWVYSVFGNNFVSTMSRLGRERDSLNVVSDQIGSPTWARDLAQALINICLSNKLADKHGEVYHYSNDGVCSWYDFAYSIMQLRSLECALSPILTEQYPTPARRPHMSLLWKDKIKNDFGLAIPHWFTSLQQALPEFAE
ncbi:dTDP-4-dehydrorhamnose reductase [uncultured Gilvimarinus sp.]|uniref:dTDP-4-dehydrorhamnose reductase n=1 Tax=uncultured Gilvimarinus sp. TaxID=1689143 RepID=UPI0030EB51E5|tara:strand:+ start:1717 stop:2598 length:882 start_codon:yes stop_codon:yes gene_type:complete